MESQSNEVIQMFVEESREHLCGIEDDLLKIEEAGDGVTGEVINKVFRAIHTIKGSAAFFSLSTMKELSHAMENVLGRIRSGALTPKSEIITVLLDGADCLRSMINDLENSERIDITEMVSYLNNVIDQKQNSSDQDEKNESPVVNGKLFFKTPSSRQLFEIEVQKIIDAQQIPGTGHFIYLLEFDSESDTTINDQEFLEGVSQLCHVIDHKEYSETAAQKTLVVLCAASIDTEMMAQCIALPDEMIVRVITGKIEQHSETGFSFGNVTLKNVCKASEHTRQPETVEKEGGNSPDTKKTNISSQESSLRVNIKILDKLMTLAGEMVLTRNELLQNTSAKDIQKITAASQQVDTITSELQEAIMSTRMQSIGFVFNKFRRIVRDLAKQLSKQVSLEIEGEDVELDKSIIEAVGDPLTHIVRNAVDHGLELPEERVKNGKPPEGRLSLKARHEAGHVVIEITDDGKGIDPSVIRRKVREQGLVDEASLAGINDREIMKFIFKAGFSTAEKVTEISGRGVGMDVVQSNLSKVGGAVDISSILGQGTTLSIKLPLTLAIIPSLLVIVESAPYAIPQANLIELVRVPAAEVKRKIEKIGNAVIMRLRGELLPLIRVSDVLGIDVRTFSATEKEGVDLRREIADRRGETENSTSVDKRRKSDRRKSPYSAVNVVVVSAGECKYGLVVDSLLDSAEIVVKPLGYHLCDCREYAGATILGDGQVALILDIIGIKNLQNIDGKIALTQARHSNDPENTARNSDEQSFLIIENGENEFFAVPVGFIARIEKIKVSSIKDAGGKRVFQYRGGTLRVFSIEEVVDARPRKETCDAYAIIFQIAGREVSIIASEIIDTVDVSAEAIDDITHLQPGIIGSTVINNSIALILDIFAIVKTSAPEFSSTFDTSSSKKGTILIVEDSPFFMHQIKSFIEDAGYSTITAEDGIKGLAVLNASKGDIDLILTDIEMPNMDGYEMTRKIRADEYLRDIPIIAVTSVIGDNARQKGLEAGMDEYLIKLERNDVLAACKRFFDQKVTQSC